MKLKRYQSKYLNKETKRQRIPISAFMVYLLLAVTLTTGASFSRYSTTVSGSDSAKVAKWEVSMNAITSDGVTMNAGDATGSTMDGTYTFTVSSRSEVAMEYSIEVAFSKALPAGVSLTVDGSAPTATSGNTYTFSGGSISAGDTEAKSHTLTITGAVAELNIDFADAVTVRVIAEQVD